MGDFHEWGRNEWISLADRLTGEQKSLITVISHSSFYFLHTNLCFEPTWTRWKQTSIFIVLLLSKKAYSCPVLWRHSNAGHWHCEVIVTNCSGPRDFAQSWYWLVDINRHPVFTAWHVRNTIATFLYHGCICTKKLCWARVCHDTEWLTVASSTQKWGRFVLYQCAMACEGHKTSAIQFVATSAHLMLLQCVVWVMNGPCVKSRK